MRGNGGEKERRKELLFVNCSRDFEIKGWWGLGIVHEIKKSHKGVREEERERKKERNKEKEKDTDWR